MDPFDIMIPSENSLHLGERMPGGFPNSLKPGKDINVTQCEGKSQKFEETDRKNDSFHCPTRKKKFSIQKRNFPKQIKKISSKLSKLQEKVEIIFFWFIFSAYKIRKNKGIG